MTPVPENPHDHSVDISGKGIAILVGAVSIIGFFCTGRTEGLERIEKNTPQRARGPWVMSNTASAVIKIFWHDAGVAIKDPWNGTTAFLAQARQSLERGNPLGAESNR
ncbi:hypothetical protein PG991_012229 [Apiospora marii]|uniref:Uncharacterized protein n=1 Tax=Apiospora marii TaxID=335849 RepID=A0ABR1R9F8_9PEZI